MPNWVGLVRLLRRRLVLGLIFAVSLTYCAFSLFQHERKDVFLDTDLDDNVLMNDDDVVAADDGDEESFQSSGKPFLWQMQALNAEENIGSIDAGNPPSSNDSDSFVRTCRNSIQGKALIVDERGMVCARQEVLPSGCCSDQKETIDPNSGLPITRERYSCETCNEQGCCAVYEYCVSCCLHPGKVKGRKEFLREVDQDHNRNQKIQRIEDAVKLRLRNLDRFQICLAACRTSSASVRHENTYKDPHSKYCYDLQPPGNPYYHRRYRRDLDSLNNNDDTPGIVVTSSSAVQLFSLYLQLPGKNSSSVNYPYPRNNTLSSRIRPVCVDFSVDDRCS
ncbi:UPF0454 protein C12orf49 homolog [Orussus abietinus]|uniref:UPF0454 protein C12orf49 homolog n=1 Tax=Orussus abietinus TaxID=222816 RepID=UPI00062689F6|nr:UPF0454 protein C12orf49 homolog [Orussus abietinus]